MTQADTPEQAPLLASGIVGLDVVLNGGFLRGGIHVIQGDPGAGKTILGNQLCFRHVAQGGRALYVTLLAETHSRMLLHIRRLAFFDESVIPDSLYYISAFRTLETEGLRGLLTVLRREVQTRGVDLLVLDGLVAAAETAGSASEYKKFIHELQTQAALADCTMFLLTGISPGPPPPEHTMVDGVIMLESKLYGRRAERDLEVLKRRGLGYLRGRHSFRLSDAGMTVFPRVEALLSRPTQHDHVEGAKVPCGIAALDEMLGGGLPDNSATMLVGPSGVGKTTAALQFLCGSDPSQPGLFFGFFETPARLRVKARTLRFPFERLLDEGQIEVHWQPTTEAVLDEIGHRLMEAVRRRNVRRLVLDGLSGLEKLTSEPARLKHFLAALILELRALGVTTLLTDEVDLAGSADPPLSGGVLRGTSDIAENIVALRFVALRGRLHPMISIVKVRDGQFDRGSRGYVIGEGGIVIDDSSDRAEAILAEAAGQANRRRRVREI